MSPCWLLEPMGAFSGAVALGAFFTEFLVEVDGGNAKMPALISQSPSHFRYVI